MGLVGEALICAAILSLILQICYTCKLFSYGSLVLTTVAFLLLLYAHAFDRFEFLNVFLHSHTHKPLLYKIGGVWGSHEGSMLLWCFLLSIFNTLLFHLKLNELVKKIATTLFALLTIQFFCFLLFASNPFEVLLTPPHEGQDLNPVLQDFSLTIHPPHLYLGTLGFALPFIISISALIGKNWKDQSLFHLLRTLTLWAFLFLTIGILLGSIWAYYELGWGGWWFFDPVENLALAPWLLGLVSLHTLVMAKKENRHQHSALIGAALPFLMCLGSLCLVRSGMLNSIHNFASDSKRAILLLIIFLFWLIFSITCFWKSKKISSHSEQHHQKSTFTCDRSTFLKWGMHGVRLLFSALLLGILLPLVADALSQPITLGMGYFTETFIILGIPISLFMLLAPHIPFSQSKESVQRIFFQNMALALPLGLFFHVYFQGNLLITLYGTLGALLFITTMWQIAQSFSMRISRKKIAQHMAHGGFGLALIGIILSSVLSSEENIALPIGKTETINKRFSLMLQEVQKIDGPNYKAERALITLRSGTSLTTLAPEERFYWTQNLRHMETAIGTVNFLHQVHVVLGDRFFEASQKALNTTPATLYYGIKVIDKPYINLMWCGFVIMIMGIGLGGLNRKGKNLKSPQ